MVQWSPGVSGCCCQDLGCPVEPRGVLGLLSGFGVPRGAVELCDPSPCGEGPLGMIPWCSGMWGRILGFPEGPL